MVPIVILGSKRKKRKKEDLFSRMSHDLLELLACSLCPLTYFLPRETKCLVRECF